MQAEDVDHRNRLGCRMNRIARITLATTTAGLLALGATACGDDDEPGSTPSPTNPTTSSTATSGEDDVAGIDLSTLETAVNTAVAESGGQPSGVSAESGVWEVDLLAPDGTETIVTVSANGEVIQGQPRTEPEDDEDLQENRMLVEQLNVEWDAALQTARGELTDEVAEMELSEENGQPVWEVSTFGDGPGTTVIIDASTGDVIGTDD